MLLPSSHKRSGAVPCRTRVEIYSQDDGDIASDESVVGESKECDDVMEVDETGGTEANANAASTSEVADASAVKVPTVLEATIDAVINEGTSADAHKHLCYHKYRCILKCTMIIRPIPQT
jgi:hypothetical protein